MPEVLAAVAGALVVLGMVLLSVLRTVFCPRLFSSRMAVWSARIVARVGMMVARRMPGGGGQRLLNFCAPLGLCVMVAGWLAGLASGFLLLAVAAGLSAGDPLRLLRQPDWAASLLAVGALISTMLVLTASAVYLVWYLDAREQRERLVAHLAAHTTGLPEAEDVLDNCLRYGSRDNLDERFAEWAGWLQDVHRSHLCYPGLLYDRPGGRLPWTRAAVVMMDAAALVDAVAPTWAPPHTRVLLDSGADCLQQLAHIAGVRVPRAEVSLHGREERAFVDSLKVATDSGLPAERDAGGAWEAFQRSRVRYAPYATMLGARLLLQPEDRPVR